MESSDSGFQSRVLSSSRCTEVGDIDQPRVQREVKGTGASARTRSSLAPSFQARSTQSIRALPAQTLGCQEEKEDTQIYWVLLHTLTHLIQEPFMVECLKLTYRWERQGSGIFRVLSAVTETVKAVNVEVYTAPWP